MYRFRIMLVDVIASSLFLCIGLGFASLTGAFRMTPDTSHLGALKHGEGLIGFFT